MTLIFTPIKALVAKPSILQSIRQRTWCYVGPHSTATYPAT